MQREEFGCVEVALDFIVQHETVAHVQAEQRQVEPPDRVVKLNHEEKVDGQSCQVDDYSPYRNLLYAKKLYVSLKPNLLPSQE